MTRALSAFLLLFVLTALCAAAQAAEAIAAQEGLGYRIFLVRRYLAMDVILPYVVWITLLAFLIDRVLTLTSQRLFPWFHAEEGGKS